MSAEAYAALLALCEYHRLEQREVLERLVLGLPLSARRGDFQAREGLSDEEMRAMGAING